MSGPRSDNKAKVPVAETTRHVFFDKIFSALAAIVIAGMTSSICLAVEPAPVANTPVAAKPKVGPASGLGSGPMVITSSSLTANRESGTAIFEGSVVAKNNDVTIRSDYMLVKYAEGGDVTSIESTGNVSFVTKSGAITSDHATYYAADKKLVFSGSPRAVEGSSVVTGQEITYYIEQEKYTVKDSKVLFEGKRK